MRIQTSRELGSGYRRIVSKFPDKQWNLQPVKNIRRRVDQRGSATERKPDSGRPRSARTADKWLTCFADKKMHREPARARAVLRNT